MKTLNEAITILELTPRRVRQLTTELGLKRRYEGGRLVFSDQDIQAMKRRNRKGGRPRQKAA